MAKWARDNGLTIVLLLLFAGSLLGQAVTGYAVENEERRLHGLAPLGVMLYLSGGQFLSALFENWESEFLQMWAYVMLTAYLYQRGSPESRDPDGDKARPGETAAEVRNTSLLQFAYRHSLGGALLALFLISFVLHWINSTRHAAETAVRSGAEIPTLLDHLGSPQLWFESFQNWQSEFLSTAILVSLGIFLRELKSPESKAVADPNAKTGSD
jgi:hypothetical protein